MKSSLNVYMKTGQRKWVTMIEYSISTELKEMMSIQNNHDSLNKGQGVFLFWPKSTTPIDSYNYTSKSLRTNSCYLWV